MKLDNEKGFVKYLIMVCRIYFVMEYISFYRFYCRILSVYILFQKIYKLWIIFSRCVFECKIEKSFWTFTILHNILRVELLSSRSWSQTHEFNTLKKIPVLLNNLFFFIYIYLLINRAETLRSNNRMNKIQAWYGQFSYHIE